MEKSGEVLDEEGAGVPPKKKTYSAFFGSDLYICGPFYRRHTRTLLIQFFSVFFHWCQPFWRTASAFSGSGLYIFGFGYFFCENKEVYLWTQLSKPPEPTIILVLLERCRYIAHFLKGVGGDKSSISKGQPRQPQRPQWPLQLYFIKKICEFDVSINPGTKLTYSGLLMWNGSSKSHYFIDFGHPFIWRLWRTGMLCTFNQIKGS